MDADLFGNPAEQPPHRGVDTSVAAAERLAPRWAGIRARCLALIKREGLAGLTCDEIADESGLSILSVRPAVCVLAKAGAVADSGGRRKNDRGNIAIVWVDPSFVGGRSCGPA